MMINIGPPEPQGALTEPTANHAPVVYEEEFQMAEFASLFAWWSWSRRDNFITSNPSWNFGGEIVTLPGGARIYRRPPDYLWARHEGYIFAAENPQSGLLPLHLWWNDAPRQDNFTTTNPRWQGRPNDSRTTGDDNAVYRWVDLQGYVIPPDRSTIPPGVERYLLPIYSWWSVERGDNFMTTNPYWEGHRPGETRRSAEATYVFVRHEGFAFSWHDDWQIPT